MGGTGSQGREHRDSVAEFCSGYIVQFRHQRRFPHFAEMLDGGLRQSEPVMPIAQRVLNALHSGDELLRFSGRLGELGRIAGALAQNSVLVQQRFGDRRVFRGQSLPASLVATARGSRLASGLKFLPARFRRLRISRTVSSSTAFRSFFSCCAAQFDQMVYELRLAPRFLRDLQASQCSQLHVEIAHFAGTLANPAQQLQKLFLIPVQSWARARPAVSEGGACRCGNGVRSPREVSRKA